VVLSADLGRPRPSLAAFVTVLGRRYRTFNVGLSTVATTLPLMSSTSILA
jgi:hypothetical protein